jgi:hypothetical protein
MRSNLKITTTICAAVFVISFTACNGAPSSYAGNVITSTQCEAPGVSAALRDALCRGDALEIRKALFSVDSKPGEASRDRLLAVLKRLWVGDQNYGKGLLWSALESLQVRGVFADYLAQGVRNAEIAASLAEMQQLAVKMVQSASKDVDQLEGLRLLGITDAQDQVPLLRSVALATEGSALRQRYAIEALGYICATEAATTLREVKQMLGDHEPEMIKTAEKAEQTRARLSSSWCRDSAKSARVLGSTSQFAPESKL